MKGGKLMEQRSTKGSNKSVPVGGSSLIDDDLLARFGIEPPEFMSIPEMQSPKFTDFSSSDFQKKADEMMEEARRESERMFAESRKWLEEGRLNLEKARSEMDFKEYTDSEGYQVVEGRSKDGYRIIQRMKRNGTQFISEIQIYKDGELTFRSNSSEDKFSYRDTNGKLVESTRTTVESRKPDRTVYKTSHATVYKRKKKKSTNAWKWLLIIGIAAAVIYYVFLR